MDGIRVDIAQYNRWAWDQQVAKGNRWTRPVTEDVIAEARVGRFEIVLTPMRPIPREWLDPIRGKRVLCLASGGGQQAPILAAAGGRVTTVDNSPRQLQQDQLVANREGLEIRTILGDMRDLSMIDDCTFDLVIHPCSNGFVDDVRQVWKEASRVLRPGGSLLSGFANPIVYMFDYEALEAGALKVKHKIPYSDVRELSAAQQQKIRDDGEPLMFGHSLEDQLGGQTDAGLMITGFYEDRVTTGPEARLCEYIAIYAATRARKPD